MLKNNKKIFILCLLTLLTLSACQTKTGCTNNDTQCFALSKSLLEKPSQTPALDPQFQYIKLYINGHEAWLAQGGDAKDPRKKVYYSSDRSVFKWSYGRLSSVTLPTLNWRERLIEPFAWSASKPLKFNRELDSVDGHIAVTEQRELMLGAAPQNHRFSGDASQLIWLHEHTSATTATMAHQPSFDSWYAFQPDNMDEPVYGQQCISKQYCLSWQLWKNL